MDPQTMAAFAALGAAMEPTIETQIGRVPQQYRAYVPIVIAGVVAAGHAYASGTPWQAAIWNGVAAASGAMIKHDAAPATPPAVPPVGPPVDLGPTKVTYADGTSATGTNLPLVSPTGSPAISAQGATTPTPGA
jgi:hypothetical protein